MAEKREIIYTVDVDSGKATKGIKETEDAVNDLGNSVEEVAERGATMRESLQIGQAVIGGIAAFKGATALLGVENEKLLKTLTQLLGAQQMLSGIQKLMNTLESQNIIILKAKALWLGIVDKAAKLLAVSTAAVTGGITLLIAAGAGLLMYFSNQKKKAEEARIALEEQNKALEQNRKEIEKFNYDKHFSNLDNQVKLLKAQGAELIDILMLERQIAQQRASAAQRAREQAQLYLTDLRKKAAEDENNLKLKEEIAEKEIELRQLVIDESNRMTDAEVKDIEFVNFKRDTAHKAYIKFIDENKKANEDLAVSQKKINEEIRKSEDAEFEMFFKDWEKKQELRKEDVEASDKFRQEQDEKEREAQQKRADFTLQNFYTEQQRRSYDRELELEQFDLLFKDEENYLQLRSELIRKFADEDAEYERNKRQEQINFAIQSTQNLLNAVSSMNEAAMNNQLAMTEGNEEAQEKIRKKHFENQKKINTALALVHTFQSAQAAFASQLIVGDPTSLVRAKLAAVFATITGLANVAKIRSTQYMGGGGGATPVMAVTNMGMPIESSQQNFENINPTTTVSTSQTEMKVYVTSKDIRNALDDRSFIEKVTLT